MRNESFVHDFVHINALLTPNGLALVHEDERVTWREFNSRMLQMSRALSCAGVNRGATVAILDAMSVDYVILHYAVARLGAIFLPVNAHWKEREIAYAFAKAKPRVVVTSGPFITTIRDSLSVANVSSQVVIRESTAHRPNWENFLKQQDDTEESCPQSWDDAHMLLFTSGSTGLPKGTLLSHRRTVLDASATIGALGVRPGWRFLLWLPLFHTGGWGYIQQFFTVGGAAVLQDKFDAPEALKLIEKHRVDATYVVPLVMHRLLEDPAFVNSNLSSLKLIAYGSYDPNEIISTAAVKLKQAGAAGVKFAHAYGLTEGGPFVTLLRTEDCGPEYQSIGTPVPGVTVGLLAENGDVLSEPNQIGELCVRSAALMTEYLDDPAATEEAFAHGWLHTGDLAYFDDNGRYFIVDRKKDMIRSAGENVYAKEVERVLVEHPSIVEAAVIGVKDDRYDERVVAIVATHVSAAVDEVEVIEFVRSRIATFKAPRQVHFVSELPRTPAGKIAKNELRDQYDAVFRGIQD